MLKRIFWTVEDIKWNIRCRYNLWLHGPYGLSRIVEKMPFRFLVKYLRNYGATIGNNPVIEPGIIIHRPDRDLPFKNLTIGNGIYIGHNNLFDLSDKIILEDSVKLGAGCQLWTHVGYFSANGTENRTEYKEIFKPIIIKRNSICYSGVIISPGVIIGENSRIGANSVITMDIPANSFSAGNPAVVKKKNSKEYL